VADTPLDDESPSPDAEIAIEAVAGREGPDGTFELLIKTSRGEISGVLHPCEGEPGAVLYLGGALGGLDGPANGLYPRLARELAAREGGGLTGLRLHYRMPGEFLECVLDALAGISFLKGIGARRVVVVGHSFGAAVAIKAGELSELACGVGALSSQLYGTRSVERLSKPLLLAHGTLDSVLDCEASRDIYARAREPKQLVLYDGAGHGLTQCADELFELLRGWLLEVAGGGGS
jgi:pimeloyl-ACP methyl ester carboxylesterase